MYEQGVPVGKHPLVARWILGDRSLHPPQRSLVPPWDLSVILGALTEKPYEPLRLAPLKLLTLKVLFLIATASTCRAASCIMHWSSFSVRVPFVFHSGPKPSFPVKDSHGGCAYQYLGHRTVTFFTQSLLALWSVSSTLCVLSVRCEFIFAMSHVPGVQTDLCLFTGTRLKRTSLFLSSGFLLLWMRWSVRPIVRRVIRTTLFVPPSFYSGHGSFLGRNCQSVGFGNLSCGYLVILVYFYQTLSFEPC